jgi:hypothetical protein
MHHLGGFDFKNINKVAKAVLVNSVKLNSNNQAFDLRLKVSPSVMRQVQTLRVVNNTAFILSHSA